MSVLNYLIPVIALFFTASCNHVEYHPPTDCSMKCNVTACREVAVSLERIGKKAEKIPAILDTMGEGSLYAATSCQQIAELRPQAKSGYYFLQPGDKRKPFRVYCDMNNTDCGGGVWTRIANMDMTKPSHSCPNGLEQIFFPKPSCRKTRDIGSSSATFDTFGMPYTKVCGKIIGYQRSSPDAFLPYHLNRSYTVDNCYVDGAILTYNSYPRQHIWTFAAMQDGYPNRKQGCRCGFSLDKGTVPEFVGEDYFCETGEITGRGIIGRDYIHQALWDGKGIGTSPVLPCDGFRSPWFKKEFPYSINSDIELRICMDQNRLDEDVLIEQTHIYTQ